MVNSFNAVRRRLRDYDNVFLIDEYKLPQYRSNGNVFCTYKGYRGVFQPYYHRRKPIKTMMEYERSSVLVVLSNFDLSVSRVSVQCREHFHLSQTVDSFFHAGVGI